MNFKGVLLFVRNALFSFGTGFCSSRKYVLKDNACLFLINFEVVKKTGFSLGLFSLMVHLQGLVFNWSSSSAELFFWLHPQQHSAISQQKHPGGIACATRGKIQTESKRTADRYVSFLKDFIVYF